jgi:hypothetical protein
MESQILALKKAIGIKNTNWYFKYQLVLQVPIGTSNTNWYFKYQLNWYFKYQWVLQIPIDYFLPLLMWTFCEIPQNFWWRHTENSYQLLVPTTRTNYFYKHLFGVSTTNWYFYYQLVLRIPIGTSNTNWYFEYQLVLSDRGTHEEMELILTRHFDKFSV